MRAFPEGSHATKDEPGGNAEVLSLDTPLPDRRHYGDRSGGRRNDRSGYQRRSGGKGGGIRTPYGVHDERRDMKNKLVKLGDSTDRLFTPALEVARAVDAFLAPDFYTWEPPRLQLGADDELLKIEDLGVSELLHKTVLQCPNNSTDSNTMFLIHKLVECVLKLPHKHSYYATMLLLLLQEAVKTSGDIQKAIQVTYGHSDPMKGESVTVKGEVSEYDESGSPSDAMAKESSGVKGETKIATKSENLEHVERAVVQSPHVTTESAKKVAFYINLCGHLLGVLKNEIEAIWMSKGGLHSSRYISNGLRFWCDLCNISIVDPNSIFALNRKTLKVCLQLLTMEPESPTTRALVEHASLLTTRALFWLNEDIYLEHEAEIIGSKEALARIAHTISHFSHKEYINSHPILSFTADGNLSQQLDEAKTEMDQVLTIFAVLESRSWISKVIPRLYNTPKLAELKTKPLSICAQIDLQLNIIPGHWLQYVWESSSNTSFSDNDMSDRALPPKVELYKPPPICLSWTETPRMHSLFNIFETDTVAKYLEVESLNPADIWLAKAYVENTIHSFFEEPDNCAETLLYIPIKHDQYTFILIETVFEICLQPPHGPLVSKVNQKQAAVFLTQLLHRLCVLEKSLVSITVTAFTILFDVADKWDEFAFNQLVCFLSQWLTYDDAYATEVMKLFLTHEKMKSFIPRKEELSAMAASSSMQDEKPQDLKPEHADKYIARIRTPFADTGCLQTSQMRFMSHVVDRLNRLLYLDTFQRKVPEVFTYFIPPQILFEDHASFADINDTETRCSADWSKMQGLRMTDLPPLEAFILKHMLKLQLTGECDENRIVNELLSFLISRVNKPFLASLSNAHGKLLDSIFFPQHHHSLKRELSKLKDKDEPVERSTKRQRLQTTSSSIKIEGSTLVEASACNQLERASVSQSEVDATTSTDPGLVKCEIIESDVPEIQSFPKEEILMLANIDFVYLSEGSMLWTAETLTKLLANTLVIAGSKTLSHSQKLFDLYSRLWMDWKAYLCNGLSAERQRLVAFNSSRSLVSAVVDGWSHVSISRLRLLLHQYLVAQVIEPVDMFTVLSLPQDGEEYSFFQTILGDYAFWDLFDSCMGVIKSDSILKKGVNSKSEEQKNLTTDTSARYTELLVAAADGCASAWDRILTSDSSTPGRELSASIQMKRVVRLMRIATSFGHSYEVCLRRVEQWNIQYPSLRATGLIEKIIESSELFRQTYLFT